MPTPRKSAPTVRDVSRHARCSPATVSRAINHTAPVSAEVRRNVLEAMRKLGYAPRPQRARNGHARSPDGAPPVGSVSVVLYRRKEMERVRIRDGGLRVGHAEHVPPKEILSKSMRLSVDFYMHIISGLVEELALHGIEASLRIVDDMQAADLLEDIAQPDRCGVAVLGEHGGAVEALVAACPHPLVLVDILGTTGPDVVTTDNHAGIVQAVDHLVALGHQRIGFVGLSSNPAYRERREAFDLRMGQLGLPRPPEWSFDGSHLIEDTAEGVLPLLKAKSRPSAIVCVADFLAMGVLRTARRCGLRVPEDLSVVGFDDIDASTLIEPALTTVRVPVIGLGRRAARQLLQTIQWEAMAGETGCTLRLRPSLVVRGTSGPPPRK